MRGHKIGLFVLTFLSLSAIPLSAEALLIQFCVPSCDGPNADPDKFTPGLNQVQSDPATQTTTDANGVTTTSVSIATFVYKQFTITGTVTSQQSATLQKISFNPTTVTANTGSGCTAANPCRIEVVATSDQNDFPTEKPAGGYPAGVFMLGSFSGTQAAGNGDTISMTGEASGLRLIPSDIANTPPIAEPVSTDVINTKPGTDPGNTGASLPSSCSGNPTCKFMATSLKRAFSTQITETVQQRCDASATSCLTRLRTRLNVEIKTSGNSVSLPTDVVTTNPDPRPEAQIPPEQKKNTTERLAFEMSPPFSSVDVGQLAVGRNDFVLTAKLKLGAGNTINPAAEEVYVRVGPFSMTIPPGKFKDLLQGKLFIFVGKVDGRDVAATFARDRADPSLWTFVAGVHNVQLTGLPHPPLQVAVEIGVGADTGSDLVTARFF